MFCSETCEPQPADGKSKGGADSPSREDLRRLGFLPTVCRTMIDHRFTVFDSLEADTLLTGDLDAAVFFVFEADLEADDLDVAA